MRIFRAEIQSNFDSREREMRYDEEKYIVKKGFIHITVEDNGSGISHSLQKKLFGLFSNTKISDQKVNQAGLGIGLTVSYLICKHMGG